MVNEHITTHDQQQQATHEIEQTFPYRRCLFLYFCGVVPHLGLHQGVHHEGGKASQQDDAIPAAQEAV